MKLIRDFKNIGKNNVVLAGGKGASLGEMTRAGIPVPPGFVIFSIAFEKFLTETNLIVEIDSILHSVNHKEIHTVENASEKIKVLILNEEIPKDIANEIQKFFKNLNSKYVAVRSSATAEDSANAAWAGQLESYLNTTEETLLENVKKCWASLFTPRAIFYRFEKNLHKQRISVAVVVQKMVESEKSGIAFSVHPVTQDRNQLIIEAGLGLGEAIVSGQITPDSYVVEKQPRRIIDKNVQTQSKGLYRAKNGGNEWQDISKEQGETRVLSDKEIFELSEITLRIENHYGFPCDIEWAFEKGKFYVVQSRPITTLFEEKREERLIFEKTITRDWPLFIVEMLHAGFTEEFQKQIGFRYTEVLFDGYADHLDIYRPPKEHIEKMRSFILTRLEENPKFIEQCSGKLLTLFGEFIELTEKIDKKKLEDLSNGELAKIISEFIGKHKQLEPTFVINFWFPIQMENHLASDKWREAISIAAKTRATTEKVGPEGDKIVTKLAKEVSKRMFNDDKYARFISLKEAKNFLLNNKLPERKGIEKRMSGFIFGAMGIKFMSIQEYAAIEGYKVRTPLRHIVTRKYGLLTSDLFIQGLADPKNYKKLLLVDAFVSSGVIFDRLCFGPQIKELGEKLLAQEEKENGFVGKVFSNVYQYGENLLKKSKGIRVKNFSQLESSKLVKIFRDFTDQYKTFAVALAGWGLQLPVEARLRARLKDRKNLDDDLAILSSPIKQNIINIEQEELIKLGIEIQKSKIALSSFEKLPEAIRDLIINHTEKFGWMTRGGLDEPWKPQEVFDRLRDVVKENCKQKLNDVSEHRKQAQEKSVQLLKELNADKKLKRLAEIAKELVYYRTYRTDYLNLIMFNTRPLLVEISHRIGNFGFPEIFYFSPQEIINWQKVDREEIEQRIKNFIILAIEPNNVIFSSEPRKIRELETEYLEQEKIDSKEIKGNIAFPGKVVGKVAIVLSKKDLPKVERGDIIVSTMTTPDYIVAMEKAAAFVTNEGGITCHAAIVAREMKKPCIIGTKIATTLLKDGDKIEVDATAGVVRILK